MLYLQRLRVEKYCRKRKNTEKFNNLSSLKKENIVTTH